MRRVFILIAFLLSSIVCISPSFANPEDKSSLPMVDDINHKVNTLIIGDYLYYMPLNMKVYKGKAMTNEKRTVNRYALKVGQKVGVTERRDGKKTYADIVFIYDDL